MKGSVSAEPRQIEGWAITTINAWLNRHYFRRGKKLPLCNITVNSFYWVKLAPETTNEFKCHACKVRLQELIEQGKIAA